MELRLAREVQQRFYAPPTALPGLELAAVSHPATETGGDYFDFIPARNGTLYVAIGDASGHGLGSALVMTLTRAYVRSFAAMNLDVGEILMRVNRMLVSDLEENRFVTLLLAHIDPRTRLLRYANAGHLPGFIIGGGDGECVQSKMGSTGPPLGLFPNSVFPSRELPVQLRELVLLVTDGVTESAGEDELEFGEDRTVVYAAAHSDRSAGDIAAGLCATARNFTGNVPQTDDITSVVVRVTEIPDLASIPRHAGTSDQVH